MNELLKKIKELKEKRAKIIADQRKIIDTAQTEKRARTADEITNYENMEKEFDRLTDEISTAEKEIRTLEKLAEREKLLAQSQGHIAPATGNEPDPNKRTEPKFMEYRINPKYQPFIAEFRKQEAGRGNKRSTQEYRDAYVDYLLGGVSVLTSEQRNLLTIESRALQADNDKTGGYLVVPEQMVWQIIEELDNMVFVRSLANVIQVPNAASLGAPSRDTDIGDVEWTAEIKTGSMDSALDFGRRDLHPHPLARGIKVSKRLLRVAMIDVAGYVAKRFGYKMGTVQENAFFNGNGVNSPLGVFIASDLGISTAQDVSTGMTTTAITTDGLINVKYSLPMQYRALPSMRWAFHRDAIKMIRKLKDGDGQYMWKQGLSDKPDTILEIPFIESEYAPNTFTTGKYVGILGAWEFYWIADALNMDIQVVLELYAATNQNGYFCRMEADGQPVLEKAFARVKLA